jgi:prepilin-type N-terminal cleavage/methylation domain-containing protein
MKSLRSRRARGFTLVELMVSLIAGLIVAMAVVALARAATNSFYDAVRISSTEQAVRVASERLRSDLGRTAYMAPGNVKLASRDKARSPAGHWVAPLTVTGAFANLGSITVTPGGSATYLGGGVNLSGANSFDPDSVVITGNFTTTDSFRGRLQGTCDGGQRVVLNADADAAVWRLIGTATDPSATIDHAFRPIGSNSIARVVDAAGCQHYTIVTKAQTTTVTGATLAAEVCIKNGAGDAMAVNEPVGTCGAFEGTEVTINPVQRVRWYVGLNTNPALEGPADEAGKSYNLYRRILAPDGTDVASVDGAPEIIAEKIADLKFGLVVDHWVDRTTVIDYYSGQDAAILSWTGQPTLSDVANTPSPHLIRSIRYRIAARTAIPDREAPFADQTPPFQTRYCLDDTPIAGCTRLSRLRIVNSEVALINQAGMAY